MPLHDIISPLPGTFYHKAAPSSPPFVEIGSPVQTDTVIGLVEVMKQFNQIEAALTGRICEILVADGESVEIGQVLMRIEA